MYLPPIIIITVNKSKTVVHMTTVNTGTTCISDTSYASGPGSTKNERCVCIHV